MAIGALQLSETAPAAVGSLVVVAVSAGGVEDLLGLVGLLPAELESAVIVVQHRPAAKVSKMAALLARRTPLAVAEAVDGGRIEPGHIYLAPPDEHLQLDRLGQVLLTRSLKVQFVRPSADVLFESAASHYAHRVLAVVMSGSGSDGADGVRAVRSAGGRVLVQDPATTQFTSMPMAAIETGCADEILPPSGLAAAVAGWARRVALAGS